jgi:PIN domain nuclease of toxin-antitoxin system
MAIRISLGKLKLQMNLSNFVDIYKKQNVNFHFISIKHALTT